MPRKKPLSTRKLRRGMYIVCEGSSEHSEYAYIDGFLRKHGLKIPSLNPIPSKKNNPVGLVNDVLRKRITDDDILWAVFDYDNPVELDEAVSIAREKRVNIALSTVSFEVWIYLHHDFTTRIFKNSDEVISEMKRKFGYVYEKNNRNVFNNLENKLESALKNSDDLRKDRYINCERIPRHKWNPCTNFDQLILAIRDFVAEERDGKRLNRVYEMPF